MTPEEEFKNETASPEEAPEEVKVPRFERRRMKRAKNYNGGKAPRGPNTTKRKTYVGRVTGDQQQMLLELFLTRFKGKGGAPGHGLTDAQIGLRMGIGHRTVARFKSLFIERSPELAAVIRGKQIDSIDHLVAQVKNVPEIIEPPDNHGGRKMILPPEQAAILTIDEMLRILSDMATAGPPQYRVQAVKLFDELQAVHRPVETFGPPTPLSEEDRVERLVTILDAVGRQTADTAYQRAYGQDPAPMEPSEAPAANEEDSQEPLNLDQPQVSPGEA